MVELLDGIAAEGSIRQSAAVMHMSYRKAWLLVRNMEETSGGRKAFAALCGTGGSGKAARVFE